jgi:C4-dicarboxylate-specific signal transduction histidine kinase
MARLLDEAIDLVAYEAKTANVVMHRTAASHLPFAKGDRVQVQQILVNLLLNGIQAMHDIEGRDRELRVLVTRDSGSMIMVAVQDTGTGIKSDDPNRIFAPFFTTKADGMGMGLSICRSIVEAQGGAITASNNSSYGATVAFTLPVHLSDEVAETQTQTSV